MDTAYLSNRNCRDWFVGSITLSLASEKQLLLQAKQIKRRMRADPNFGRNTFYMCALMLHGSADAEEATAGEQEIS